MVRDPANDFVDELYVAMVLELVDEALLGLPKDISTEELIRRFPHVYERVRQELMAQRQTAANPCDDAVQAPTLGGKRSAQ